MLRLCPHNPAVAGAGFSGFRDNPPQPYMEPASPFPAATLLPVSQLSWWFSSALGPEDNQSAWNRGVTLLSRPPNPQDLPLIVLGVWEEPES